MKKIIILDFGGQTTQLFARRIREAEVYSEVIPYDAPIDRLSSPDIAGIILSDAASTIGMDAPVLDPNLLSLGKPLLGVAYGAVLLARAAGAQMGEKKGEMGIAPLRTAGGALHQSIPGSSDVWMSPGESILSLPAEFTVTASTPGCPIAAFECAQRGVYAVMYHPESAPTVCGAQIISNFIFAVCGCENDWIVADLKTQLIDEVKALCGDKPVLSALSGGVDSAVASVLVSKAIGDKLTCVFVDHGLLRKDEAKQVLDVYRNQFGMNLVFVDARERFLGKLKGVTDPEQKRKIIGEEFIRVFEEEAGKLGNPTHLVQGTIYPDIIESGVGHSKTIKSHHNVGGLPKNMKFTTLVEPLKYLFKDEVRKLGLTLGIPEDQVFRQPFPGPGLGVRVLGEITEDKLRMVRESDAILREEIAAAGLDRDIWQYFTALPGVRSVGASSDGRTYEQLIVIRAITTTDVMTADVARIPYDLLIKISNRIAAEVSGVNRVAYDITQKPPGTVEWE